MTPIEGLILATQYRYYALHYADWSPGSREDTDDYVQVFKTPKYGVLDIHASYDLPFEFGPVKPKLFIHLINALDEAYIQDAVDNSSYNSWDGDHSADDAEVYFGLPMSFNAGLSIQF